MIFGVKLFRFLACGDCLEVFLPEDFFSEKHGFEELDPAKFEFLYEGENFT